MLDNNFSNIIINDWGLIFTSKYNKVIFRVLSISIKMILAIHFLSSILGPSLQTSYLSKFWEFMQELCPRCQSWLKNKYIKIMQNHNLKSKFLKLFQLLYFIEKLAYSKSFPKSRKNILFSICHCWSKTLIGKNKCIRCTNIIYENA